MSLRCLRFLSAGESHGPMLVGILDGLPAGIRIDRGAIDDDLHEGVANFLLILIVVHVCAALVMIVFFGENLIRAMWTGDKSRPETAASDLAGGVTVPLWRAVVAFVFAGFFALWPFL